MQWLRSILKLPDKTSHKHGLALLAWPGVAMLLDSCRSHNFGWPTFAALVGAMVGHLALAIHAAHKGD